MRTQSLLAAWNDTRTRGPFLERSPGASSQGGIRPVRIPALSKVAQKRHLLRGFPSPGRRARRRPASGDGAQDREPNPLHRLHRTLSQERFVVYTPNPPIVVYCLRKFQPVKSGPKTSPLPASCILG